MPIYLKCSNNNRASTVMEAFRNAVSEWGLPSRVRCDKDGENTEVAWFMLMHPRRGTGRGSVIAGKSVHDQRIERLWRDVVQGVLRMYSELFYYMEDNQLLDPANDIHLFSLHYVFIPRINEHLLEWKQAWMLHPLSSAHNQSPYQLWTSGMQHLSGSSGLIATEMFEQLREVHLYCNVLHHSPVGCRIGKANRRRGRQGDNAFHHVVLGSTVTNFNCCIVK